MSLPTITPKSIRKIINKAKKDGVNLAKIPPSFLDESSTPAAISVADFNELCRLDLEQLTKQERYYVEALRGAYLKDLQRTLEANKAKDKKKANWLSRLKFILLMVAGTIFFGCEGFDGVTALFSIFNLPTVAIYVAGMAFSILSILVFYAFDLMEISHNLGVNFKSTPKLVDLYTKELESIKLLRIKLNLQFSDKGTAEELEEYLQLMKALKTRREEIFRDVELLKKSLNNPALLTIKKVTAFLTGLIFFSGGFFAGKTVALAIAGLFVASVSPQLAIGILVVGLLVAAASFAIYWYVERPGIENIIGRMIGLDKEKIDKITDVEETNNETKDIEALLKNISARKTDLEEKTKLTLEVKAYEKEKKQHALTNETHLKVVEELNKEITVLKDDKKGLQSELDFEKERGGKLVLDHGKMMIDKQDAVKKVATLEEQLEQLKKQLEKAEAENKKLQSALDQKNGHPDTLNQASTQDTPSLSPIFKQADKTDIHVGIGSRPNQGESKITSTPFGFFNASPTYAMPPNSQGKELTPGEHSY